MSLIRDTNLNHIGLAAIIVFLSVYMVGILPKNDTCPLFRCSGTYHKFQRDLFCVQNRLLKFFLRGQETALSVHTFLLFLMEA